jgi:hypothetical protein
MIGMGKETFNRTLVACETKTMIESFTVIKHARADICISYFSGSTGNFVGTF